MTALFRFLSELFRRRPQNKAEPQRNPPPSGPVLGVVIGHTYRDGGAAGVGILKGESEYSFYKDDFLPSLQTAADAKGVPLFVTTRDSGGISGAYSRVKAAGCAAVVELHFNSAGATSYGTETLGGTACFNSAPWAHTLQEHICRALNRKGRGNRGVKFCPPHPRGGASVNALPTVPSALIEPAFAGSNIDEAALLNGRVSSIARAVISAFVTFTRAGGGA